MSGPTAAQALTDEQIAKITRAFSNRHAEACNVDPGDYWQMFGNDLKEDVRFVLETAATQAPAVTPAEAVAWGETAKKLKAKLMRQISGKPEKDAITFNLTKDDARAIIEALNTPPGAEQQAGEPRTQVAWEGDIPAPDVTEAPDYYQSDAWKKHGCHVCGKHHGTNHYFNVCGPKSKRRKQYLEFLAHTPAEAAKGA